MADTAQHPEPRVEEQEAERRGVQSSTESIVQSFRNVLLSRAERHGDSLEAGYRDAAQQLRGSLYAFQQKVIGDLEGNLQETSQEIDNKLQEIRDEIRVIAGEASKFRGDLDKSTRELDAALAKWNDVHGSTFKALERFQKEYRDTIATFDMASARTEKIVEGLQGFKNLSLLLVAIASGIGTVIGGLLWHLVVP